MGALMWIGIAAQSRNSLKSSASFGAALAMGLVVAPMLSVPTSANPAGAAVASGGASISNSPGKTEITQTTEGVVIDWKSFNIGSGQSTNFMQPNAQAIAVNRIGGADASRIMGTLDANGRIVLINGNGLLFGKDSK